VLKYRFLYLINLERNGPFSQEKFLESKDLHQKDLKDEPQSEFSPVDFLEKLESFTRMHIVSILTVTPSDTLGKNPEWF